MSISRITSLAEIDLILEKVRAETPAPDEFHVEAVQSQTDMYIGVADSGEFRKLVLVLTGLPAISSELRYSKLRLFNSGALEMQSGAAKVEFGQAVVLEIANDNEDAFRQIVVEILGLVYMGGGAPEIHSLVRSWAALLMVDKSVDDSTILGLWGEILVLCQFFDPEIGVKAWHVDAEDRWDFVLAEGFPLEVKTTTQNRRVHHFSANQLNDNSPSGLSVLSLATGRTDTGTSVRDLIESLRSTLSVDGFGLFLKKLTKVCNPFSEKLDTLKFDAVFAKSNFQYFEAKALPRFNATFPIVSISWAVDFEGLIPGLSRNTKRVVSSAIKSVYGAENN